MAAAVEKIVLAAQAACGDDDTLRDLGGAATAVTEALNQLIEQIRVREISRLNAIFTLAS